MQITEFRAENAEKAAQLLSLCVGARASAELEEYRNNPSVRIFCAESDTLCGIMLIMPCAPTCDILDIAVDPSMQGQGIGRALFAACTEFCRKHCIDELLLEVRMSNTGARAFYEKLGFEQIAKRKNYYAAPTEDAAVMRKTI